MNTRLSLPPAPPGAIALLAMLAGLSSLSWPFVVVRQNRVTPLGDDYSLFVLHGQWGAIAVGAWLLLAAATLFKPGRLRAGAMALALTAAAAASHAALTWGAAGLVTHAAHELARVAIAGGAWGTLAALYLGAFALHAEAPRWLSVPVLALAALACAAPYEHLGLVQEYREAAEVFQHELLRHVMLVACALLPAVLLGAAIGTLAARKSACENMLLGATGLLQTIPSIALFGLLLPLLGLGPAPAVVAMALYGLWPVVVATHAGLSGVPAAMLDAARGMGMSTRQVFWRVELPLAAPFLIDGVRGAMLMLIGLATVAVLVNAGGLGYFLVRGTEQAVPDLVLLGSLPVVTLAFGCDAAMRALAWGLAPQRRVA